MKRINNSVIALSLFVGIANANAQEKRPFLLTKLCSWESRTARISRSMQPRSRRLPLIFWKLKTDSFRIEGFRKLYVSSDKTQCRHQTSWDVRSRRPEIHQVLYGSANLSVPIYSGGRIKYGIQSAKYLVEASKLSTENDKTAIAYNVAQAYNNLFKANQSIKVFEENLAASQKGTKLSLKWKIMD